MKPSRFFSVTFLAAFVLLIETVLFHMVSFLFDYFEAIAVVSWAVLGIGLGAFAAAKIRLDEERLYSLCALGATVALYGTMFVLLRYQVLPLISAGIALDFFFPVLYIAVVFRTHAASRVYLYDMAGAGLGVLVTVALFEILRSEGVVLVALTAMPLSALIRSATRREIGTRRRIPTIVATAVLAVLGGSLLAFQVGTDGLNLIRLFNSDGPYDVPKVFKIRNPNRIARSYDSLVGRIDLLRVGKSGNRHAVCYNGYGNDQFRPGRHKEYRYYEQLGIWCPASDKRVLYGLVDEPRIFIIGSAARGITQTARAITPLENITAVEIDPSIVRIMAVDYFRASGMAYANLNPIVGNALSVLNASQQEFDIITLINTHSGRTIGYPSGPDYLHTFESYGLYMDHLSERGYVLFEERPFNRGGDMGMYRMINTMWHVLAERGSPDPSRHFFIWEWAIIRGRHPTIDLRYDEEKDSYVYAEGYYRGMIVTREPLVGEQLDKVLRWYHECTSISRLVYLKDVAELGTVSDVFDWIERGDLSALAEQGYDTSIVTNDRPFSSLSKRRIPELHRLFVPSAVVFGVLLLCCLAGLLRGPKDKAGWVLAGYNVSIGFGYFFVEILLLQVYQNVFVSPSMTLVLVLGLLLISSGVGGMFAERLRPALAAAALMPVSLAAIFAPGAMLAAGVPALPSKVVAIVFVCACGFLMGPFFPKGLALAAEWGSRSRIPVLFAVNSVAGSFAVVLALYMGIEIGYSKTLVLAFVAYALAALLVGGPSRGPESAR